MTQCSDEKTETDSAGVYFLSMEEFEWRPAAAPVPNEQDRPDPAEQAPVSG